MTLQELKLDGFLVPMADEYQNEYVSDHDKRIEFISGFSGSAAFIIVLNNHAIFFTDGRYTLQAEKQLPTGLFNIHDSAEITPTEWMTKYIPEHSKIAFDPHLHTAKQIERLEIIAFKKNITLIPIETNPIDAIWQDQPQKPTEPITPHHRQFAGESSSDKRRKICEKLKEKKTDAIIITDPASVAWLLNVRGNDVQNTPLPLSTIILHSNQSVQWFVDPHKTSAILNDALENAIIKESPTDFEAQLKSLGTKQSTVQIDPNLTSFFVANTLRKAGAKIVHSQDPCIMPRACKNKTEIKGMISAHNKDGVALARFLSWLDNKIENGEEVTELKVDEKLTAFRAMGEHYKNLSFPTIAGSGPNGAIVHYLATEKTNRSIKKGEFLLIDSGAQYLDGTTDVTRTIPIGEVTEEMKDRYTRVLKGHIALAKARFPSGIAGSGLDALARQYLWDAGLDYSHGTGHGVGCYLGVHEGPHNISRRGDVPLRPGMVTSNEPGYYENGHYGIRHENLQYVIELDSLSNDDKKMLGFRPLTLAPFDRRALLADMLTPDERAWLNEYHAYVYEVIAPQLDGETKAWLEKATTAI